ncbi:MAG: DUF4344 domain-containing metallopeptidase [Pseudomonadota bacterium]
MKILISLTLCLMLPAIAAAQAVSNATKDAILHVIAHEMGHALIREFDLPILGPEEDMADDFATLWIHRTFPDRAADILTARALEHMSDPQQPGVFSEYRNDAQRAGRSICLAYGIAPDMYRGLAGQFEMSGDDAARCQDWGPEVARSWRRVWTPLLIPNDAPVTELGSFVDGSDYMQQFAASGVLDDALMMLAQIDWHSRITLNLAQCDGTAGWSRNGRRITVCEAYIRRFDQVLGD